MSSCTAEINAVLSTGYDTWSATTKRALDSAALNATEASTLLTKITNTAACLEEKLRQGTGSGGTVMEAQGSVLLLRQRLEKERENIRIAKDRAKMMREGGAPPSYYDSWFPLGRPMTPAAVPLFIGLSLFFALVSLFLAMSFFGFELKFFMPAPTVYQATATRGGLLGWLQMQFSTSFWIVLVAFIIALVYAVRR